MHLEVKVFFENYANLFYKLNPRILLVTYSVYWDTVRREIEQKITNQKKRKLWYTTHYNSRMSHETHMMSSTLHLTQQNEKVGESLMPDFLPLESLF